MNIRKSKESDINEIMRLIHQAQKYFKNNGIDQWQDNYPQDIHILEQVWEPQSQFWVSCTADCAFPPLEWCSRVALQLNTHLATAWTKHGQLPTSGLPK